MSNNPQQVDEVFDEALRRAPGEERERYLAEACGDDAELKQRVERLLRAVAEAGSFLESPAEDPSPTIDQPITEKPGTTIGRYKLLEQIGEGGFGVVFMAEQQEPVRRKVALKIIKPGMDTKEVIARFEAERQTLALMDHPNIARVLDAAATESGRPYFVMELVRGIPITDYCDQNNLPARERLELFGSVCQAVQHAHQKGIIHRDIKPSNVMVTLRDDTPVAKVIDFGVAKATNARMTEKTLFTRFGQMVGTPLYMSPEQAGMSELDVDTRSDIYSLGVLLYELLTGATPFDQQRIRQAAYDELLHIIREEEPPKPSTRVSTLGEAATTSSAHRKTNPKRLSQFLRGELDWIVMKALEKDRSRRYETAKDFAADVRRYLNDQPIEARPPSHLYRLRKLTRRHKVACITGTVITVTLIVATTVSMWSAVVAVRERDKAAAAEWDKGVALQKVNASEQLTLRTIAGAVAATGEGEQVDDPVQLLMGLLEVPKRVWGEDDPRTLSVASNIAFRLRDSHWAEAVRLYEWVYEAQHDKLGADHADTQRTAQGLSYVCGRRAFTYCEENRGSPDDLGRALKLAKRCEEVNPGGEDSWVVAWVLFRCGKTQACRRQLEESISAGSESPGSWMLLAMIDSSQGDTQAARDWYAAARQWLKELPYYNYQTLLSRIGARELGMPEEWPPADWTEMDAFETFQRLIKSHPGNVCLLARSGSQFARLGKWEPAADCYSQLVELEPDDHWHWYRLAFLLLATDRVDIFLDHSRAMVQRADTFDHDRALGRALQTSLMRPDTLDDWEPLVAELEEDYALRVQERPGIWAFRAINVGLAKYRAREFEESVNSLQRICSRIRQSDDPKPIAEATAMAVLAMAQCQLGYRQHGRDCLQRATEILHQQQTKDVWYWHDWLRAELLRREAEELLAERTDSEPRPDGADSVIQGP